MRAEDIGIAGTVTGRDRSQRVLDGGPPRLLFVINDSPFFLSHRLPIARGARDAGFDVHVAAPGAGSDRILTEGFSFHPLRLNRAGVRPSREIACIFDLVRLFRTLRPTIVHTVTIKPVVYGGIAARLSGIPNTVSSITGLGYLFSGLDLRSRVLRVVARRLYRRAFAHRSSRVIFQNPDDLELFVRWRLVNRDRAVLIRGSGVDLHEFSPTPEPPGTPLTVLPSRMLWSKGVGEFVGAVRRLRADGTRGRFALVGGLDLTNPEGIAADQIDRWVKAGDVEWWGFREDMPDVLASSHIICLPSTYGEGVPKALIEAAAAGRPIVTTDTPGCREIVRHGENGLLVPPRDEAALARALSSLIGDSSLRRRMGEQGRSLARSHFDVHDVVERTIDVYRNLIRLADAGSAVP